MKIPGRFIFTFAIFCLMVLLYIDRISVSAAKDQIAGDLGFSDAQMGWIMSAFALGYALLQTPAGMLADRYGPRRILAAVVVFWSVFTGLTALAWNYWVMLVVRFLFGAGEAGALPATARAIYAWVPLRERGVVQGISFSGMRLGAAFAMPAVVWAIQTIGWKTTFIVLMGTGFVWALGWMFWFRDDPALHPGVDAAELEQISAGRAGAAAGESVPDRPALPFRTLMRSGNMWLAMGQYFCSNFTFFFCLTWLYPHIRKAYNLDALEAGWYAMAPLIGGAVGNIASGWMIDRLYRTGHWELSRRLPAMVGFILSAVGLIGSLFMDTPLGAVAWLTLAIFGADMTLPPAWSLCVDIGGKNSGAVSGTMNMAGNMGSFVTGLAFPYLIQWTGGSQAFFIVGAVLNTLAILAWAMIRPRQPIEE